MRVLLCVVWLLLACSAPTLADEWLTVQQAKCVAVLVYDGDHRYWGQLLLWDAPNNRYVTIEVPRAMMSERGSSPQFAKLVPRLAGSRVTIYGWCARLPGRSTAFQARQIFFSLTKKRYR